MSSVHESAVVFDDGDGAGIVQLAIMDGDTLSYPVIIHDLVGADIGGAPRVCSVTTRSVPLSPQRPL